MKRLAGAGKVVAGSTESPSRRGSLIRSRVLHRGSCGDENDRGRRVPAVDVGSDHGPAAGTGHPILDRLDRIPDKAGFDAFVGEAFAQFYVRMGRAHLTRGS